MEDLAAAYGGRVRVRVGALIFDRPADPERVLLVKHVDADPDLPFWTPPGGGVEFGESLTEALRREVREETGLQIDVGELMYVLDFVRPPLHAVSFYFRCRIEAGEISVGTDPELAAEGQFIEDVQFISFHQFDRYTIVPEGLSQHLARDAQNTSPEGSARYLGTKR